MKNLISLALLLLLPLTSFAAGDFSGHWRGSGRVTGVLQSNCPSIDLQVTQTATSFVIEKYTSTCDLYGSSWGPSRMTIEGERVFERGEEVGRITEESLRTAAPDGNVVYLFNLKLVPQPDGSVALDSEYGVRNFVGTLMTVGRLVRVP